MATEAPFSASARPSPVRELTPEAGDAAATCCPCSRSLCTSLDPMSPVPPITTIFMVIILSCLTAATLDCRLFAGTEQPIALRHDAEVSCFHAICHRSPHHRLDKAGISTAVTQVIPVLSS